MKHLYFKTLPLQQPAPIVAELSPTMDDLLKKYATDQMKERPIFDRFLEELDSPRQQAPEKLTDLYAKLSGFKAYLEDILRQNKVDLERKNIQYGLNGAASARHEFDEDVHSSKAKASGQFVCAPGRRSSLNHVESENVLVEGFIRNNSGLAGEFGAFAKLALRKDGYNDATARRFYGDWVNAVSVKMREVATALTTEPSSPVVNDVPSLEEPNGVSVNDRQEREMRPSEVLEMWAQAAKTVVDANGSNTLRDLIYQVGEVLSMFEILETTVAGNLEFIETILDALEAALENKSEEYKAFFALLKQNIEAILADQTDNDTPKPQRISEILANTKQPIIAFREQLESKKQDILDADAADRAQTQALEEALGLDEHGGTDSDTDIQGNARLALTEDVDGSQDIFAESFPPAPINFSTVINDITSAKDVRKAQFDLRTLQESVQLAKDQFLSPKSMENFGTIFGQFVEKAKLPDGFLGLIPQITELTAPAEEWDEENPADKKTLNKAVVDGTTAAIAQIEQAIETIGNLQFEEENEEASAAGKPKLVGLRIGTDPLDLKPANSSVNSPPAPEPENSSSPIIAPQTSNLNSAKTAVVRRSLSMGSGKPTHQGDPTQQFQRSQTTKSFQYGQTQENTLPQTQQAKPVPLPRRSQTFTRHNGTDGQSKSVEEPTLLQRSQSVRLFPTTTDKKTQQSGVFQRRQKEDASTDAKPAATTSPPVKPAGNNAKAKPANSAKKQERISALELAMIKMATKESLKVEIQGKTVPVGFYGISVPSDGNCMHWSEVVSSLLTGLANDNFHEVFLDLFARKPQSKELNTETDPSRKTLFGDFAKQKTHRTFEAFLEEKAKQVKSELMTLLSAIKEKGQGTDNFKDDTVIGRKKVLRELVTQHFRHADSLYAEKVFTDNSEIQSDLKDYVLEHERQEVIDSMSKFGRWGSHLNIAAFTERTGTQYHVIMHSSDGTTASAFPAEAQGTPVHIQYVDNAQRLASVPRRAGLADGNHYEVLVRKATLEKLMKLVPEKPDRPAVTTGSTKDPRKPFKPLRLSRRERFDPFIERKKSGPPKSQREEQFEKKTTDGRSTSSGSTLSAISKTQERLQQRLVTRREVKRQSASAAPAQLSFEDIMAMATQPQVTAPRLYDQVVEPSLMPLVPVPFLPFESYIADSKQEKSEKPKTVIEHKDNFATALNKIRAASSALCRGEEAVFVVDPLFHFAYFEKELNFAEQTEQATRELSEARIILSSLNDIELTSRDYDVLLGKSKSRPRKNVADALNNRFLGKVISKLRTEFDSGQKMVQWLKQGYMIDIPTDRYACTKPDLHSVLADLHDNEDVGDWCKSATIDYNKGVIEIPITKGVAPENFLENLKNAYSGFFVEQSPNEAEKVDTYRIWVRRPEKMSMQDFLED